jgi:glucokinase
VNKFAIGTDIGGSHICSAAIDLTAKSILKQSFAHQKVDNQAAALEILCKWAAALNQSIAAVPLDSLAGIAFAIPGPFDYARGIAKFTPNVAKYQNLYNIHITDNLKPLLRLPDSTEDFDFRYINDAASFGIGEAWLGKAVGTKRSLTLTLGTGLGSAFIEDGVPVVDRDDVPRMGTLWHAPFNGDIADATFSTRWFINRYAEKTGTRLPDVKQIALRATNNEAPAKEVFTEFGVNLGNFLTPWLKKFDAQVLVIGGNIATAHEEFLPILKNRVPIPVHISDLKEDAALLGAARLFASDFWPRITPLLLKMCPA